MNPFGSLRYRFMLVMLTASLAFGLAVTTIGYVEFSQALRAASIAAARTQLETMSGALADRVLVEDRIGFRLAVDALGTAMPRLEVLVIENAHGRVLAVVPPDASAPTAQELASSAWGEAAWVSSPLGSPDFGRIYARVDLSEDDVVATAMARRLARAVVVLTGAGILVAGFMGFWLTAPLDAMRGDLERVAAGDSAVRVDIPDIDDEVALLARAINASLDAVDELQARERARLLSLAEVERMAAVGGLAAGVAHEVANPLAGVTSCVRQLGRADLPPQRRERYAQAALDGLERSTQVLRDLLDFARPAPEELSVVSPLKLTERVVGMVERSARCAVAIEGGDPIEARWPAGRVEQILLNLLLNAAHAAEAEVRIRWERVEGGVLVEVLDDGEGPPPGEEDRVFEPFYTTREPGAGTGLGLAVAKTMITRMGGRLGLDRTRDGDREWTRAWFELPLRVDQLEGARAS